MGFFDKPAKGGLQPVSKERITKLFDEADVNYGFDDDGDVIAGFGPGMFWFMVTGADKDILRLQSRWRATIPADQFDRVVSMANEFNGSHYFPRCFVQRNSDGETIAFTDLVADCTHGITDDQLNIYLSAMTGTSNQFFEVLAEAYPELAATIEE